MGPNLAIAHRPAPTGGPWWMKTFKYITIWVSHSLLGARAFGMVSHLRRSLQTPPSREVQIWPGALPSFFFASGALASDGDNVVFYWVPGGGKNHASAGDVLRASQIIRPRCARPRAGVVRARAYLYWLGPNVIGNVISFHNEFGRRMQTSGYQLYTRQCILAFSSSSCSGPTHHQLKLL